MELASAKAAVIFSGGQDSTTCLLWAKKKFASLELLNFHYGQRHAIEEECASTIARLTELPLYRVDLSFMKTFSKNALTGVGPPDFIARPEDPTITGGGPAKRSGGPILPSTFVVGRNALFLTVAVAWGLPRGIHHYVFGACQVDYSGYPDCREKFVQAQEKTLSLATDSQIHFHAPLMNLSKAQIFELAHELGGLELVLEETHTCYLGDRRTRHAWGYGCGSCPACVLREKGFKEYGRS